MAWPPNCVSVNRVLGKLVGLETYYSRMAAAEYPTSESDSDRLNSFVTQRIQSAMGLLERKTGVPFFITRYTTRALAAQYSLVQGTDFDLYHEALSYDVEQWRLASGRTELPRMPLASVDHFDLTLENAGDNIIHIPDDWLNKEYRSSTVHIMPWAINDVVATKLYYLFSILPFARPGLVGMIPLLVHVAYRAGLVDLSLYSGTPPQFTPEPPYQSSWEQTDITTYALKVAEHAAGQIMKDCAPAIRGWVNVSLGSRSRSANSPMLTQMGQDMIDRAECWGLEYRQSESGPGFVFV